jgi:hypothetical protein
LLLCAEVVRDGKLESWFGKFKLKQDGIREKLKVTLGVWR